MHVQTGCKRKPVTRCDPSPFQNLPFGGFALPAPTRASLNTSGCFVMLQEPPNAAVIALETPSYLPATDSFFGQASIFPFSKSGSCLRDMRSIINTPTCLNNVQRTPGIPPNTRNTTCIDMFEKTDIYEN